VILLDNSNLSFLVNPDNGIPIESWIGNMQDCELLYLLPILEALRFVKDARSILSLRS
jgi:TFIIF-interacting CTD phosphatase-like protein